MSPAKPAPPPNNGHPVVNVRNTTSPYWRNWLKREFRCLIPVTSFCEYTDSRPKVPHWFALNDERPIFAFAGIWRSWSGIRGTKTEPVTGEHVLFSFLTTGSNGVVGPIHAKAMPVILREQEFDIWLDGEAADVSALQRPAPDDWLKVVAIGTPIDNIQPMLG